MAARSNLLHYRNVYARIILLTMENVLGKDILNAVLYSAGLMRYSTRYPAADFEQEVPASDIRALFETLSAIHSSQQALQIAYVSGQAIARYLLAGHWGHDDLTSLPIRALSQRARQESGLQIMNDLLCEFSPDYCPRAIQHGSGYLFVLNGNSDQTDNAIHHVMLGFLTQGMHIFSLGEHEYQGQMVALPDQRSGLYIFSPVA